MEEYNMGQSSSKCCEPDTISECKECAQMQAPVVLIRSVIQLESRSNHLVNFIPKAVGLEEMAGENGESLCIVEVVVVSNGSDHIYDYEKARKNVGYSKEGCGQWASKVGCHSCPI